MTGCEWIIAYYRMVTSKGNTEHLANARVVMSDRRIVEGAAKAILREVAKRAAQDAGKAAQEGEI